MSRPLLLPCLPMAVLAIIASGPSPASAASCESLATFRLPQTTITSARSVSAGTFQPPSAPAPLATGAAPPVPLSNLPGFCRVAAILAPTTDSAIGIEVWMPAAGWNHRFQGVGNGGFAGTISYGAMADALRLGNATASTDTGHMGPDGSFGMKHPEKVADWGYRAIHVMTEASKAIVQEFYGSRPEHSYFTGCSTGGHQGLSEAQRYPADYDGILAGDHGANRTHLHASFIWAFAVTQKSPAAAIPATKLPVISKAVLDACDALDGVKDGFLTDPRRCKFSPSSLLCAGADEPTCLTAPQVDAVRKLYDGTRNPRTGELIYPGWPVGSETFGGVWTDPRSPQPAFSDLFKYWVFEDPAWDWRTFDFDRDLEKADAKLGAITTALNPELGAFRGRGGKLILYHGFDDTRVAPQDSIDYFGSVVAAVRPGADRVERLNEAQRFARLFMIPGMGHCSGGPGPTSFDGLGALEQWVEHGVAPERIIGSHIENGAVTMTRPLCAYPEEAVYTGRGRTEDAGSFVCRVVK